MCQLFVRRKQAWVKPTYTYVRKNGAWVMAKKVFIREHGTWCAMVDKTTTGGGGGGGTGGGGNTTLTIPFNQGLTYPITTLPTSWSTPVYNQYTNPVHPTINIDVDGPAVSLFNSDNTQNQLGGLRYVLWATFAGTNANTLTSGSFSRAVGGPNDYGTYGVKWPADNTNVNTGIFSGAGNFARNTQGQLISGVPGDIAGGGPVDPQTYSITPYTDAGGYHTEAQLTGWFGKYNGYNGNLYTSYYNAYYAYGFPKKFEFYPQALQDYSTFRGTVTVNVVAFWDSGVPTNIDNRFRMVAYDGNYQTVASSNFASSSLRPITANINFSTFNGTQARILTSGAQANLTEANTTLVGQFTYNMSTGQLNITG